MAVVNNISRNDIIKNIQLRLGGGLIDVELTPDQLDLCVNLALRKFRQLSDGAVEESYIILKLNQDQKEYILPNEVLQVQQVYRRGFGRGMGSAGNLEPFGYSAFSQIYMAGFGGLTGLANGGLTTYELYNNYLKTAARMFGAYMNFQFNNVTKKITFMENPRAGEEFIVLQCYNERPEEELFKDMFANRWIEDWALSEAKLILATVRNRFGTLPGPNGAVSQDGEAQRSEAQKMQEQLLKDISHYITGGNLPVSSIYLG